MEFNLRETQMFVEVKKAANILGVTEKHIYEMIQTGKIEALRIGPRGIRVSKNSIDLFIRENRVDPLTFFA